MQDSTDILPAEKITEWAQEAAQAQPHGKPVLMDADELYVMCDEIRATRLELQRLHRFHSPPDWSGVKRTATHCFIAFLMLGCILSLITASVLLFQLAWHLISNGPQI